MNNGRCTLVKAVAACYKILTIIIDMKFAVAGIHIKSTDSKIFSALAVKLVVVAVFVAIVALSACSNNEPWNNPYPAADADNGMFDVGAVENASLADDRLVEVAVVQF